MKTVDIVLMLILAWEALYLMLYFGRRALYNLFGPDDHPRHGYHDDGGRCDERCDHQNKN